MELSDIGIKKFTDEELIGGVDRHHIVFKSQGGVNHRYNMISMLMVSISEAGDRTGTMNWI